MVLRLFYAAGILVLTAWLYGKRRSSIHIFQLTFASIVACVAVSVLPVWLALDINSYRRWSIKQFYIGHSV